MKFRISPLRFIIIWSHRKSFRYLPMVGMTKCMSFRGTRNLSFENLVYKIFCSLEINNLEAYAASPHQPNVGRINIIRFT